MKKRLLAILLSVCLVCSMTPPQAKAAKNKETSHEMTFEPCMEHEIILTYKDDKSHANACKWCGYEIQNEKHHYDADGHCDCGAVKTLYRTENGDTVYAGCRLLENNMEGTFQFPDKWYTVRGNVKINPNLNPSSDEYIKNDVNIIVPSGSTLTISGDLYSFDKISVYGYGQLIIEGSVSANILSITDTIVTIRDTSDTSVLNVNTLQLSEHILLEASNQGEGGVFQRNITIPPNPSSCWQIWAGDSEYHPNLYSRSEMDSICGQKYVRIKIYGNHRWEEPLENGKHICETCGAEFTHTTGTRYIVDDSWESIKIITAKSLDGVCENKGWIALEEPEVSGSLTDIIYDGEEHPARITENTIQGVIPEITYSYQAPGEKTYTQMGKGKKPVDVGAYTATISLTGGR